MAKREIERGEKTNRRVGRENKLKRRVRRERKANTKKIVRRDRTI